MKANLNQKFKEHTECSIEGKWYKLAAKEGTFDINDPVDRLDVSILQNNLLRSDSRN